MLDELQITKNNIYVMWMVIDSMPYCLFNVKCSVHMFASNQVVAQFVFISFNCFQNHLRGLVNDNVYYSSSFKFCWMSFSYSCYRRFRLFYPGIKSLHLLFGRPRDLLSAVILSLEILTNLLESNPVTCLSHSPLFLNQLVNWLNTAGFLYLLTSNSILFCFANYYP